MNNTYQSPRGGLLSTIIIFLFILMLFYTLFLVFQKSNIKRDMSNMESALTEVQAEIDKFEEEKIRELFVAQEVTDKIKAKRVLWSQVIKKMEVLTPVSVFITSFSGSKDGVLNLSALADDAESVSTFISALYKSKDFDGAFVPSITEGTTAEGQTVVSFNLTMNPINAN